MYVSLLEAVYILYTWDMNWYLRIYSTYIRYPFNLWTWFPSKVKPRLEIYSGDLREHHRLCFRSPIPRTLNKLPYMKQDIHCWLGICFYSSPRHKKWSSARTDLGRYVGLQRCKPSRWFMAWGRGKVRFNSKDSKVVIWLLKCQQIYSVSFIVL